MWRRFVRWAGPSVGLIYAASLVIRLRFWKAPAYGDEGLFFFTARHLTGRVDHQVEVYSRATADLAPFFWYRPLHALLLWPGAQFGFDAYRLNNILLASLLPVAAFLILRREGVRPVLQHACAGVIVLAPIWVVWGYQTVPDTLLTLFMALAVGLRRAGRFAASWVAAVAATWTKEVGIVGMGVFLVIAFWEGRRDGSRLWPLRLNRDQSLGVLAAPCAIAPFAYSQVALHAPPAGGPGDFDPLLLFEMLMISGWLVPWFVAGALWPRTRWWTVWAAAHPAFYLVLGLPLGRFVHLWYFVLPTFFVLVATTLAMDETIRRAARARVRSAVAVGAALVFAVLFASILVDGHPAKGAWARPLTGTFDGSFDESLQWEMGRERDLWVAVDAAQIDASTSVALLDVHRDQLFHPFTSLAGHVEWAWSEGIHNQRLDPGPWALALEAADVTILARTAWPISNATLQVYGDCIVHDGPTWVVLRAQPCTGRRELLSEALGAPA